MTSSTPEAWLQLGRTRLPLQEVLESTINVDGRVDLRVGGAGWLPESELEVLIGSQEHSVLVGPSGSFELDLPRILVAAAGTVIVQLLSDGSPLQLRLRVTPTRLAQDSLSQLLDALEALAPGLAGDLGGRSGTERAHTSPTEGTLRLLERLEGPVVAACGRIRTQPIVQRRLQQRAVVADTPPRSPTALRWLAQHPAQVAAVQARGRAVAVARTENVRLDVPENQGVLYLLAHLDRMAGALAEVLDQEQARLLESRPEREAFLTSSGNLFTERDLPRLKTIERKRDRVTTLRRNLERARRSLSFPPPLRPRPFARSPRIERHPAYWSLFRAWMEVKDQLPLKPTPAFLPLKNTDELYELWTTLEFVDVLGEALGEPLLDQLPISRGWFAELPSGELCRTQRGHHELIVYREPAYAYRDDGPIQKLLPGRPWRPDIVLEHRVGGQPIALHVFDAKHSLQQGTPDGAPLTLFQGLWWKYVDGIGTFDGAPLVESCWALYPGSGDRLLLKTPSMLERSWPLGRPRGGCVALVPGRRRTLARVLNWVVSSCMQEGSR